MNTVMGWWFSAYRKLPHFDGRRVKLGRTHTVDGEIKVCRNGLHLSRHAIHALAYATGPIVWRVRAAGVIVEALDKLACSQRTYVAGGVKVQAVLLRFARLCALDVLHLWQPLDFVAHFLRTGDGLFTTESVVSTYPASNATVSTWAAFYAWRAAWAATISSNPATFSASAAWYAWIAEKTAKDPTIDVTTSAKDERTVTAWVCPEYAGDRWDEVRAKQNKRLHRMLLQAIKETRT